MRRNCRCHASHYKHDTTLRVTRGRRKGRKGRKQKIAHPLRKPNNKKEPLKTTMYTTLPRSHHKIHARFIVCTDVRLLRTERIVLAPAPARLCTYCTARNTRLVGVSKENSSRSGNDASAKRREERQGERSTEIFPGLLRIPPGAMQTGRQAQARRTFFFPFVETHRGLAAGRASSQTS